VLTSLVKHRVLVYDNDPRCDDWMEEAIRDDAVFSLNLAYER